MPVRSRRSRSSSKKAKKSSSKKSTPRSKKKSSEKTDNDDAPPQVEVNNNQQESQIVEPEEEPEEESEETTPVVVASVSGYKSTAPAVAKPRARNSPRTRWTMVAFMTIVCVAAFALKTCFDAGEFKLLAPLGVEGCERLDGPPGLEDMVVFDNHWLIASSHLRLEGMGTFDGDAQAAPGELYAVALLPALTSTTFHRGMKPVELVGFPAARKAGFSPHGLTVDGNTLYVVNHGPDGDCIEVFEISTRATTQAANAEERQEEVVQQHDVFSLRYLFTLQEESMQMLNDLDVRANPTTQGNVVMWISRWKRFSPETWQGLFEMYTQRAWGSLLRCTFDRQTGGNLACEVVVENMKMPNGVALVGDHKNTLVVVESIARAVRIYHVGDDNTLERVQDLAVNSACDNVGVERDGAGHETGTLLVACHPKALTFMAHSKDAFSGNTLAPSQVLRLSRNVDESVPYVWEEVFLTGPPSPELISASSIAVSHSNSMYIGAVFEFGLLRCPKP